MRLNDAGRMVERWWFELNRKFATVETDEFVLMPNHFHGIVAIAGVTVGADLGVGPVAGINNPGAHTGAPRRNMGAHTGAPLHTVVQWFKTMTTNEYMCRVKTSDWPAFAGRLWQRNYYEHVIRNDKELSRIREYIVNNPGQWELDRENPDGKQNPRSSVGQRVAIDEIESTFGGIRP